MPAGAGTQAGALNATKSRLEIGPVGATNVLAPKKASSPAPDVVMKDVDSVGATNSGGIGASAKSARGAAATRRKDGNSPSPKEGSPSVKEGEPTTPQELERQKLAKLLEKSQLSLSKKLGNIESNLSELEEAYISETWPHGNCLRGWDGYIRRVDRPTKNTTGNGSGSATGAPKVRKPKITDRIFSLSSASSQVRKEVAENQAIKKSSQSKKKKKR